MGEAAWASQSDSRDWHASSLFWHTCYPLCHPSSMVISFFDITGCPTAGISMWFPLYCGLTEVLIQSMPSEISGNQSTDVSGHWTELWMTCVNYSCSGFVLTLGAVIFCWRHLTQSTIFHDTNPVRSLSSLSRYCHGAGWGWLCHVGFKHKVHDHLLGVCTQLSWHIFAPVLFLSAACDDRKSPWFLIIKHK